MAKPDGVEFRPARQIVGERLERHPFPFSDFGRVRRHRPLIGAAECVDDLVLDVTIGDRGAILRREQRLDLATHAHFLGKPPMGRFNRRFVRPRVAAARIGPQPAGMVFFDIAAMNEHIADRVTHQH
jgi:hypothetical protein